VSAVEVERFGRWQLDARQNWIVVMRKLLRVTPGLRRKDFTRQRKSGARKRNRFAVFADRQFVIETFGDDLLRYGANARLHRIDRLEGFVFRDEVERFAVGGPGYFGRAAVERCFGEVFVFLGLAVVKPHAIAIGFVAVGDLGVVGDEFSIRRVDGIAVEAGIFRDAFGLAARDWNGEEIGVGADGFDLFGDRGEADFAAIGREIQIIVVTAHIGRHVVVRALRQISRSGACFGLCRAGR